MSSVNQKKKIAFLTAEQVERLSKYILKKFDLQDQEVIDITALTNKLGYDVYDTEFESEDISGMVENTNGNCVIHVNKNETEVRKRFTIAHELSHILLHHNYEEERIVDYRRQWSYYQSAEEVRKEVQANMLAAALLIPAKAVRRLWDKLHDMDTLAQYFQVSRSAISVRLETLGLDD